MNPDLVPDQGLSVPRAARGLAGIEEARADLAEDLNLNPRLLLERAFLRLAELAPRSPRARPPNVVPESGAGTTGVRPGPVGRLTRRKP